MTEGNFFYQEFLSVIREKIPHKTTLVNTITDLLDIDKDAVYRRLRGGVNFSFTEMAIIAKRLGVSLDKIARLENVQSRPAQMNISNQVRPTSIDYEMFSGHIDLLKSMRYDSDAEITEAANILPHYIYQDYEHITRYYMFRWNQVGRHGDVLPYHEIAIAEPLRDLQIKTCTYARHISSTLYVWDNMVFQRLVTDINYFAKVRLINKEDVALLKNDLMLCLDNLEQLAIKGKHENTGKKVSIFISDVASDTNYSLLKSQHIHLTLLRAFILNATVTFDVEVFNYARAWIQAMQRKSILISVSGEKLRAMYFEAQRDIVNTL